MQNLPLVTVICLCYNHEKFVKEALNSVLNQTYPNIELIIVDDNSKDLSVVEINEWINENPNFKLMLNDTNKGNTKSFNKALSLANGDYIIDLAADDILLPDCVAKQIKTFQNSIEKKLGIVYGNMNLIDESSSFISIYYKENEHPESGNIYNMIISRSTKICSVSSMIKKSVFDEIGGYDETLAYEDLDFWLRTSTEYSFQYIPDILVQKRELSTSLSAHYSKRNNKLTHNLHYTTLRIFEKMLKMNTKKEHFAIMRNRIHFEMIKFLVAREYILFLKLCKIEIIAWCKSWS